MTTVLITGASRGLGLSAAVRLAEQGATVFAGVRDPSTVADRLGAEADRLDVRPVPLDVTDDASVAAAVHQVSESVGALDVVINNAGLPGSWAPADEIGPDDFAAVLQTNVVAPVRVTRAFLSLLLRGDQPRLIMVSSGMGSLTLQTTDEIYRTIAHLPYPASKAALNMLTVQYAKNLPGVIVTAVDPGLTATDFTAGQGHSVEEGSEVIVSTALDTVGPSGRFLDRHGVTPW